MKFYSRIFCLRISLMQLRSNDDNLLSQICFLHNFCSEHNSLETYLDDTLLTSNLFCKMLITLKKYPNWRDNSWNCQASIFEHSGINFLIHFCKSQICESSSSCMDICWELSIRTKLFRPKLYKNKMAYLPDELKSFFGWLFWTINYFL